VKSLTMRGIVLSRGRVLFNGTTDEAIHAYVQAPKESRAAAPERSWGRGVHTAIRAARLIDGEGEPTGQYLPGEPLRVEVELETDGMGGMSLELFLKDMARMPVGMASPYHFHGELLPAKPGTYLCRFELEPLWLASGSYTLDVRTAVANVCWDHTVEEAAEFDVPFSNPLGRELDFKQTYGYGAIAILSYRPMRIELLHEKKKVACES
jgi:lipopolysaccharide transport system ATP-binding protein